MKLFVSTLLLTLIFQTGVVTTQRSAVRVISIPKRDNGYSNFDSRLINTEAESNSFLAATSKQSGWNSRQAFVDALKNANIDFATEALVLLRHSEGSGSVRVTLESPTLVDRKLIYQIRGKALAGMGTMDMAYYCFAVVVSRSLVSEVDLLAVEGGFKERKLAPMAFPLRAPR